MLLAKISPSLPGPGRSGQLKRYLGRPPTEESTYVQFIVFYISEVWHKIQGRQNVMFIVYWFDIFVWFWISQSPYGTEQLSISAPNLSAILSRAASRRKKALPYTLGNQTKPVLPLSTATEYRPSSISSFLSRLATYKLSTYANKPPAIDAVAAAKCGWINDGKDRLVCGLCKSSWVVAGREGMTREAGKEGTLDSQLGLLYTQHMLCLKSKGFLWLMLIRMVVHGNVDSAMVSPKVFSFMSLFKLYYKTRFIGYRCNPQLSWPRNWNRARLHWILCLVVSS